MESNDAQYQAEKPSIIENLRRLQHMADTEKAHGDYDIVHENGKIKKR